MGEARRFGDPQVLESLKNQAPRVQLTPRIVNKYETTLKGKDAAIIGPVGKFRIAGHIIGFKENHSVVVIKTLQGDGEYSTSELYVLRSVFPEDFQEETIEEEEQDHSQGLADAPII